LLQEFTNKGSLKFNYYFISGPDKDEFNAILKPLSDQKNFYIFSSKSLSTDETLSCLRWLGTKRDSTNSIVITGQHRKSENSGLLMKIALSHFQKQLEADIQFGHLSP
jgi:glucose-6-phosphate isomerase